MITKAITSKTIDAIAMKHKKSFSVILLSPPFTGQVRPAAMRCAKQRDCAPIHILLQFMSKVYNIWNILLYYVNIYPLFVHKNKEIATSSRYLLFVLGIRGENCPCHVSIPIYVFYLDA